MSLAGALRNNSRAGRAIKGADSERASKNERGGRKKAPNLLMGEFWSRARDYWGPPWAEARWMELCV